VAPTDAGAPDGGLHAAVQNILGNNCVGCHSPTDGGSNRLLPSSLDFTNVSAVVGVRTSTQCPGSEAGAGKEIVNPGHPETSYMVDKVLGRAQDCGCFGGARMPFMCVAVDAGPADLACLSNDDIQTIINWIAAGAN
jgi:hypothetical protein